ncbi:MAG: transcription elongation factor GreA [Patescibacteria group bacterium]|jgi:transcription elongation factor GreA
MNGPLYVSKAKLEAMKLELHFLKTEKRQEIAARIEKAKELGDLSENADYTEAKEEYSFTEGHIIDLADQIMRAEIIEVTKKDVVSIGARVKVNVNGKEKDLTIVGSTEASPLQGLISNESPIGKALIGKRAGDEVEVAAPSGPVRYRIISIG